MLRVIGDVHGKQQHYLKVVGIAEHSLCVGDVGFDYTTLDVLDPVKHRLIGGNHDNYTQGICCSKGCKKCEKRGYTFPKLSKHFLQDFGVHKVPGMDPIFYVRGAWSIDQQHRIENVSWWKDEELTGAQGMRAFALYEKMKPDIVITHTIPGEIIPLVPFDRIFGRTVYQNFTEKMLTAMFEIHQPKLWIFGHFHKDWIYQYGNTKFICLNELSHVDLPVGPEENYEIRPFQG